MDADGKPKLHVIKECPRHHFLTYIVYRDWPFLSRFNRVLSRFAEGGKTVFIKIEVNLRKKKVFLFRLWSFVV